MFSWEEDKGTTVGAALLDVLSKPQEEMQVQEVIDEYAGSYVKELEDTVAANFSKYVKPFYIVVLHKKEPWSVNILRNWFVARQSQPTMKAMWALFPNHSHTVYKVTENACDPMWSLPTYQEARTILLNSHLYHEDLVKWCSLASSDSRKVRRLA